MNPDVILKVCNRRTWSTTRRDDDRNIFATVAERERKERRKDDGREWGEF